MNKGVEKTSKLPVFSYNKTDSSQHRIGNKMVISLINKTGGEYEYK